MNEFEMVPLIVLFVMVAAVLRTWIKSREKLAQQRGVTGDHVRRIDELEERIRVLERLATDKSARLREEIEAL